MNDTLDENEPPDLRGPAIIVSGGVVGGFKFCGPFETVDAALKYHQTTLYGVIGAQVSIVLLDKPMRRA